MHAQQAPAFTDGNFNPTPHYSTGGTTFPATGTGGTYTFTASGFPAPTFSATTPTGIVLNSTTGALTETGSQVPGTYIFTVTASNAVTPNATQSFTLSIGTAPAFTDGNNFPNPPFSTGTAHFNATGTASTYTFTASGDPAPTFSATTPTGIVLNSTTGKLTENGSQVPGTYTFTVTATNVLGTDTQAFTLTIGIAPQFTDGNNFPNPPFSTGTAHFNATGTASTYTFTASGDPAPTFSATTPTGIVLNSTTGVLSENGSQVPGTYTFTVTAQNGVTPNDTQAFTLTVGIAPQFTDGNNFPNPQYSTGSAQFNPTGTASTYTFTASGDPAPTFTATTPTGIVLNSTTGVLSENGSQVPGIYTFTVTAQNGVTPNDTQAFTLSIGTAPQFTNGNGAGPTYPTGSAHFAALTGGTYTFTASGPPNPTFTAAGLPGGIHLSAAGVLTEGAGDTYGTYTFTVTASTGITPNATQTFTLTGRDSAAVH